MIKEVTQQQVRTAELLFYLSAALKNGVDCHILAQEHASTLLKAQIRNLGIEGKQKQEVSIE